jgi:hypothetical protein
MALISSTPSVRDDDPIYREPYRVAPFIRTTPAPGERHDTRATDDVESPSPKQALDALPDYSDARLQKAIADRQ